MENAKHKKKIDFELPIKVVEQMYKDLTTGSSWLEMKNRFYGGGYGDWCVDKDFEVAMKGLARYVAYNLSDITEDERKTMFSRYLAVYKAAMLSDNLRDARMVLDSMSRLAGLDKDPRTTLKLEQAKDEGKVTITFGINKGEAE